MNSLSAIAREDARTDMTPMIDCVFLMIVFFVCIDFRTLEAKLPAYLPKDRGGSSRLEPRDQLSIGIYATSAGVRSVATPAGADGLDPATGRPPRYTLEGHTVGYAVGPMRIADDRALLQRLQQIHADRSTWQDDLEHPGQKVPMTVVVEPHPGTYYGDAARAADLARKAGFARIDFGGGLGPLPSHPR